jgi:septal ring factor EnvC (AmiA/AmiB activator)
MIGKNDYKLTLPLLVILMILTSQLTAFAEPDKELDASRYQLEQIQKQIDATVRDLRNKRQAAGNLNDELDKLKKETRKLKSLVRRSERDLTEIEGKISGRQKELKQLRGKLAETEKQVSRRLVALYKSGQAGIAKMLLSTGDSPQQVAEKYAFLTRMVRHDRDLLADYRQQSEQQRRALSELEQLKEGQARLVAQRRKQSNSLREAGRSKKRLLSDLRNDERLLDNALEGLRAKAARLNDLVKKLETDQSQSYTGYLKDFSVNKGRLIWPVSGKVRVGFGKSRNAELGTMLESNGFEIEAAVGSPIKVVAAGKVIYASRLRGYGKLMVIDHGGKYYTLYAHLARFDKKVGDRVASGERLAYSGYEGRDTIYFEIRHSGEPQDPKVWLSPR